MINLLKNKTPLYARILIFILMTVLIIVSIKGVKYYSYIYSTSISIEKNKANNAFLYIDTDSKLDDIAFNLKKDFNLKDKEAFVWVAKKKKYNKRIKKGRYLLRNKMSNNEIVNLLRSGVQSPVNLTFNNTRTINEFAGKISSQLNIDSTSFVKFLNNEKNYSKYGFDQKTIIAMFIPNSYQIYWDVSMDVFLTKMNREYRRFWSKTNLIKAQKLKLTPIEISVLASIVDEETIKGDEKPIVAGVYINRLNRGMKLDADPTLKFAAGDFSLRRVLNIHKKIDSPYNTYMYAGLPPGPIRQPSISGLNSVLNYQKHKYIFFCAKHDFSGYHAFAKTLSKHNRNARQYQRALNNRRIYK